MHACMLSCVQLFAIAWTVAHQAPLYIGFSRQAYWNGLPFPPPEDLPDPGIEPMYLASPTLAGRFFTTVPPGKPFWQHKDPQSCPDLNFQNMSLYMGVEL